MSGKVCAGHQLTTVKKNLQSRLWFAVQFHLIWSFDLQQVGCITRQVLSPSSCDRRKIGLVGQ
jgi:hypothetical protein